MHWVALAFYLVFLSGCGNTGTVPVRDGSNWDSPQYHRVKSGDTLYSISWRYHLDYKSVAETNDIKPPYTIYVDQKILLLGKRSSKTEKENNIATRKKKPVLTDTKPKKMTSSKDNLSWQWPIKGKVIKDFSLSGTINKGVGIKGTLGQRVNAAADGMVVYAGGNLRGYGKLIILKHNNRLLSAYGNNQEIRVSEGEEVRVGQMIAKLGSSASTAEMLHFEIRVDGRPANPLNYLP